MLASFAQLGRQQQSNDKVINFTYSNQDKDELGGIGSNLVTKKILAAGVVSNKQNSLENNSGSSGGGGGGSSNVEKKTTFAALPNTTTWQQQSNQQIMNAEANNTGKRKEKFNFCQVTILISSFI